MNFHFTTLQSCDDSTGAYLKSRISHLPEDSKNEVFASLEFRGWQVNQILEIDDENIQPLAAGRQSRAFVVKLGDGKFVVKVHQHNWIALSGDEEFRDPYTYDFLRTLELHEAIGQQLNTIGMKLASVFFANPYVLVQEYVEGTIVPNEIWKEKYPQALSVMNEGINIKKRIRGRKHWLGVGFDSAIQNVVLETATGIHTIVDPFCRQNHPYQ